VTEKTSEVMKHAASMHDIFVKNGKLTRAGEAEFGSKKKTRIDR
jgi:hypothetical protein